MRGKNARSKKFGKMALRCVVEILVAELSTRISVNSKGNLCFSFITPLPDPDFLPLDIRIRNDAILARTFARFGLTIEYKGRNDLLINGLKFSGSAFEVELGGRNSTKRVLHHGTLMLNVDLSVMEDYLHPNIMKLKSKVFSKGYR